MKISPIAKFLTENKPQVIKDSTNSNLVKFFNKQGTYLGFLQHNYNPTSSTVDICLYRPYYEHPFLKQHIEVKRNMKYFLRERKYMPVSIEVSKSLTDYERKMVKNEIKGKGLKGDRYIEQIDETDEKLKKARESFNIPEGPVYKINKLPFKYEFKYSFYKPNKHITEFPFENRREGI